MGTAVLVDYVISLSTRAFQWRGSTNIRRNFSYKTAHKLVHSGKKVFFYEALNLSGLTKRNAVKQDEKGNYLPNKQSAKSGLNKSWLDAAFGQFFSTLGYIAEKAGAVAVEKNPAYTS